MKTKKIFVLAAVLALVGCGGGNNSSSESSSSESLEEKYFKQFKDAYDSLGSDYFAFDQLITYYASDDSISASMNAMVTRPQGTFNMATKSGIALAKDDQDKVKGYRYGVDMGAEESETFSMFLPTYTPAFMPYNGFYTPNNVSIEINEYTYNLLYSIPSSEEIQGLSDAMYNQISKSGKLPKFDTMFTYEMSEDGNPTFTTNNFAFAQVMLEHFSFGKFEGYSTNYYDMAYRHFTYSTLNDELTDYDLTGIETVVTLDVATSDIFVEVYLKDFHDEYPFIVRQFTPLNYSSEAELSGYDLVSQIIPEDFYENGPGEEPAEYAAKRASFKDQIDDLLDYNYTIDFTTGSELFGAQKKMYGKVVSNNCFTTGDADNAYSYYYVPYNETQTDKSKSGIYQYSSAGEEVLINLQDELDYYVENGAVLAEDGVTISYNGQTVNINEKVENNYRTKFNLSYFLEEEFNTAFAAQEGAEGANYWEYYYGGDWIDQFFYIPRTDSFLCTNYIIKGGLLGACMPFYNLNDCLTVEFTLMEGGYPFIDAEYFCGEHFDFGSVEITNVGTTVLDATFGTFVNEKYGTNYPVETVV